MKRAAILYRCAIFLLPLFAIACQATKEPKEPVACNPNFFQWVAGEGECLAMLMDYSRSKSPAAVLVVWLHGDVSRGGAADYMYGFTVQSNKEGVTHLALMRPGYFDSWGKRSSGNNYGRGDNATKHNIDSVAEAIRALKEHYGTRRLVVVGHSGGATFAAVLLGRHPGLVDAAILLSCPCNLDRWNSARGRGGRRRSESPHEYLDEVPITSKVIALTGEHDNNTSPWIAEDYITALRQRGVEARFAVIPDAGHSFEPLLTPDVFWDALEELVAGDTHG
jgi:pimeloyl-ACP methyl ester carboxylesterase